MKSGEQGRTFRESYTRKWRVYALRTKVKDMKDMYILISMMKISAHPMSATDLFLFPFLNIFLLRLPILTRLVCSICCQKNVKKKYESETGEVKSRAL